MKFSPRAAVLCLVVCLAAAVPLTAAGPVSCAFSSSTTPPVRAEGFTEIVGDVLLTCTRGTAGALGSAVPQVNLTVFFPIRVTSRLLPNGASEALLLLDEPGTGGRQHSARHRHHQRAGYSDPRRPGAESVRGLDQVNIGPLPASLASGVVTIRLAFDGVPATTSLSGCNSGPRITCRGRIGAA